MLNPNIPFIDLVAAFFIKEKPFYNQNLMCIDFGADKTIVYRFKIENQQFIYQSESMFDIPAPTQQLIANVEEKNRKAASDGIPKALIYGGIPTVSGEYASYARLTFGDIKKGIDEWVQKCIQIIDNHIVEHYILVSDEWLAPTLCKALQNQYPPFEAKLYDKKKIQEDCSKCHDDTIYPPLTKHIGFQLYDEKNEPMNRTVFKAGTLYNVFVQATYLPFRNWVLLDDKVPFVPTFLVDQKPLTFGAIDLAAFGFQQTKKIGGSLLSDFYVGLSVNGHHELILHLKNNFKTINFNIGRYGYDNRS
jgi:hypothetical protein